MSTVISEAQSHAKKRKWYGVMHFMFRGSNLPKPNFMPHQAKEPWEGGTAKKVSKKGLLSTRGHWTSMLIKCISGQYSNVHRPLMHLDTSLLAPLKKQGLTGRKNALSHKKKQIDKKKKHHTHTRTKTKIPQCSVGGSEYIYTHPFVSHTQ